MTHETDVTPAAIDIGAFCRAVEAHLCRVNGGHLVRIVGPAFDVAAERRWRLYARGALLVSGTAVPAGCFNWSRA